MSHKHSFISELHMEAASTRKMLELVPVEKNDWKPHPKSMKLGNLAAHIATLPSWIEMIIQTDEFDLGTMDYEPTIAQSTEELIAIHNLNLDKAIAALENASEEDFEKIWTLRNGDHVIFSMPKKVVVRASAISHIIHHRAQLGVYLRLLDVPLPGVYGPSADEMAAMTASSTN